MPLFSSSKIIQFFVSDEFRVFVRIIFGKKEAEAEDENAPPRTFLTAARRLCVCFCLVCFFVWWCLVVVRRRTRMALIVRHSGKATALSNLFFSSSGRAGSRTTFTPPSTSHLHHRRRAFKRASSSSSNTTTMSSSEKSNENTKTTTNTTTNTNGKNVVLVTGSTGRVGKEVLSLLSTLPSEKWIVRAATRDKSDYAKRLGASETVTFDLTEKETWPKAMENVTHLFSSTQDKYIKEHMEFAKFCARDESIKKKLRHIVRISCFGADTNTNKYDKDTHASRENAQIPLMLQHYWWSEECFIENGFKDILTSIRGNFYMNHLLKNELDSIRENGTFTSPLGECKNSFVSCNDMGEAAFTVLKEGPERHGNKFYDICGAESTSMRDVARILTEALNSDVAKDLDVAKDVFGKTISYVPQDLKKFEEDFGSTRAEFFEYLQNGFYTRCSPDFYNLTGKRPLTYYEYLTTKGAAGDTGIEELFSAQGALFTKGVDEFKDLSSVQK